MLTFSSVEVSAMTCAQAKKYRGIPISGRAALTHFGLPSNPALAVMEGELRPDWQSGPEVGR
jgi:hypothetical protein